MQSIVYDEYLFFRPELRRIILAKRLNTDLVWCCSDWPTRNDPAGY